MERRDAPERIQSSSRKCAERRGARRREGNTQNGKYVHGQEPSVPREEEESVSPSSPFGKYDTTLEAALRPLAIYGNGSANGAWSPSCFTIFVQPKRRKKSIRLFFSLPPKKRRRDGGWQRRKGCRGDRGEGGGWERAACSLLFQAALERAPLRGKSYATSTARREAETIFTLFPRRPRFYIRSVTFHVMPTATNSCQTPTDV